MKAVWVFNDFGKGISQRDFIMLLASCKLWSIYCPEDTRVLYCSELTGEALYSLGENKLFNSIILLPKVSNYSINSSVFWSCPKLEVLQQQQEPLYLIDHDFLVLEDIRYFIPKEATCFNYQEDARNYYPSNFDERIRSLNYKTKWPEESANVSFLYLPFPDWTQFYAGTSLHIMEELTELEAPDSRYLIFAEQMVFKHMLSYLETPVKCLIKNIYECRSESWTENYTQNGFWTVDEAWGKKFIHFGPMKKSWKEQEYDRQLETVCSLAGFSLDIIQKTNYLRK